MSNKLSDADKKICSRTAYGAIDDIIESCFLCPNYDYFHYIDEKTIKERAALRIKELLSHEERVSGKNREEILRWFVQFFDMAKEPGTGIVLFGGVVYRQDEDFLSDLDIHIIINRKNVKAEEKLRHLLFYGKPKFLNSQYSNLGSRIYHEIIVGFKRFGLFNHLLVASSHSDSAWLLDEINKQREILEMAPFCDGGIGELIVYASIKIIEGKEMQYFERREEAELILSKKIPVIGGPDPIGFPSSPEERHKEAKEIFRDRFNESELYRLALAALNRIGAKKERKHGLAGEFVRKIKTPQARQYC